MTGPRRLREDPAFRLQTGCDLSAEADLAPIADLTVQRARLLSTVGAPSAGAVLAGLIAAGAGVVAVSGLLVTLLGPTPGAAVSPVSIPAPTEVRLAPEMEPVVEPAEVIPQAAEPAPRPQAVPASPSVLGPEEPTEPVEPPTLSPVQAQLAAYDRGVVLMDDGQWARAEAHFEAMVAKWPGGVLVTEARLARLDCLYRLKRWEDVVDAAEELKLTGDAGAEVIRMQHDAVEQGRREQ